MAVDNRLEALLDNHRPEGRLRERVDERQFAGGIPRAPARFPRVRLGRRWVSGLWLVLLERLDGGLPHPLSQGRLYERGRKLARTA